jgi:tetratricopeptide (TPR) repeat protein
MWKPRSSTPASTGRCMWLGAMLLLLGVAALGGRAFADVGCWDSEPPKATKGKCAAGYKYSAKKKACTKVSCGMGRVWSGEEQACIGDHSAALTDQAFYTEARARADEGRFHEALDLLARINKPRVLNMIGYSTRKLGDLDKGLEYYHKALALDPDYLLAREYLGEGYLQKGDPVQAKGQLMEIAERCGNSWKEYDKLEKAIVVFVTDGDAGTTY